MLWTVIGFGGTFSFPDGATVAKVTLWPGGAMVAVLRCVRTDTRCTNPNAPHAFSSFSVYPAPDSRSFMRYDRPGLAPPLIPLLNGTGCAFVFDPVTLAWYPRGVSPLADPSSPGYAPLTAPDGEAGAAALASVAPPPLTNCMTNAPPTTLVPQG